jgi:hypothetical protein
MVCSLFYFMTRSKYSSFWLFVGLMLCNHLSSALIGTYSNCKLLNDEIQYKLHWSINDGYLEAAIEANVVGWIGFGFSSNGYMDSGGEVPGSDIVMGYKDLNSTECAEGCVTDYHTLQYAMPIKDDVQNVEKVAVTLTTGHLAIEFRKPLNSFDTEGDRVIDIDAQTFILWSANHHNTPKSPTSFSKHTVQATPPLTIKFSEPSTCFQDTTGAIEGVIELNTSMKNFSEALFVTSMAEIMGINANRVVVVEIEDISPPFCPDCTAIELVASNYSIPATPTYYSCRGFEVPVTHDRIIKIEPIKDNTLVLHHMLLFYTDKPVSLNNWTACFSMPYNAMPIYGWAPGGDSLIMPENVGITLDSAKRYFVIQYHYSNPQSLEGLIDNSGFKIYTTNESREYEAGLFVLGLPPNENIQIPPNETDWHQLGTCPEEYTQLLEAFSPMKKLIVFATGLHAHYLGKQIWTAHYRNGTFLGYLGKNEYYSFNNQRFVDLQTEILPGDRLVTHCVWDSTGREVITTGGEGTEDEMCLNAILYYPSVPVPGCYKDISPGEPCTFPCSELDDFTSE